MPRMAIGADEVRHVAALARLSIPDSELPRHAEELGRILEHVARLQEVQTDGVPPTSNALSLSGVVRADEPAPGLSNAEAVRNAPAHRGGLYQVPRVVDTG